MAVKLCVFVFGLAILSFELKAMDSPGGFLTAYYSSGSLRNLHRNLMAPPRRPPAPETDPWRMNLQQPFEDEPLTVDESLDLFKQGLKRDPCTDYCAEDVNQSEIIKDCGGIVEAIRFLAENEHASVKPECGTARDHTCKYSLFKGFSCKFKVTVIKENCIFGRKMKGYRLSDCLAENS